MVDPGSGMAGAGSSPRTRGTARHALEVLGLVRFIPAHAGNSWRSIMRAPDRPVHPRARGEQIRPLARRSSSAGSSPRTRGTAFHSISHGPGVRFIPAHAGNRASTYPSPRTAPVHPRARGEQQWWRACSFTPCGSSPRTRGTERIDGTGHRHERFIPAHAGNSRTPCCCTAARPVHPRARGEQ